MLHDRNHQVGDDAASGEDAGQRRWLTLSLPSRRITLHRIVPTGMHLLTYRPFPRWQEIRVERRHPDARHCSH